MNRFNPYKTKAREGKMWWRMKRVKCKMKWFKQAHKKIDTIQGYIESIKAMSKSLMNCFTQGMIQFIIESIHYIGDTIQKKSESTKCGRAVWIDSNFMWYDSTEVKEQMHHFWDTWNAMEWVEPLCPWRTIV